MTKTEETFEEYRDAYIVAMKHAIANLELDTIFEVADTIAYTQHKKGRLFIIGVGGSAGNASHAVNDFRKICGIEAYTPTDNVSELTARINDSEDGWDYAFVEWLRESNLNEHDTVMILSVGGGSAQGRVSKNLVNALVFSNSRKAGVVGIVGDPQGFVAKNAEACIVIPIAEKRFKTPITEAMQSVVWHLIANEPGLAREDE
jgi:D-sedoheptulose 7-phosphate isomerase